MTNMKRRILMKSMAAIGATMTVAGAGVFHSVKAVAARPVDAFEAQSMKDALVGLYGHERIESSDKVSIKVPEIAENGAVIPVTVSADLDNIESITIFAEENVTPLIATFKLGSRAVGYAGTRIKLAKTGNVVAVVKADGKLFSAQGKVKVTIGGCGG